MSDKNAKIQLSKEKKEYMLSEIKTYFSKERNEEIGDLASMLILDFVLEKLAPEFFNQGVDEAYKYMSERLEEVFCVYK